MRRIEFFGPMGAGKSTLYSTLVKNKIFKKDNSAKNEVYNILLSHIRAHSLGKYIFFKFIKYTPIKHRVFSNYDFYHYLKDKKSVSDTIKFILNTLDIEKSVDKAKTLVRLNYFLKDLTDVVVLQNHSEKKILIHDESLIQRGVSFGIDKSLNNIDHYIDNIPLPEAVIYVSTSPDILQKRINLRDKNNIGFYGKKKPSLDQLNDSIEISEKILSILEKKEVKILKVNSGSDLVRNTQKINNWIRTI